MNVRSLRSTLELEGVRPYWTKWQDHVNNDLEQFELVCSLTTAVLSPHVIAVEREGEPRTLLLARLEKSTFAPAIGYLKPVRIPIRTLAVIYQGVIGNPLTEDDANGILAHLQGVLRDGSADIVEFHHLPQASPLAKALQRNSNWLRGLAPRSSTHRAMELPRGGLLEHKVNGKHRSRLRKKAKNLEATFAEKLAWNWMRTFDDVPAVCRALERVAAKTYQRGLGAGFFDNELFRRRFELFADRDQLRVMTLEIDGQVRAFWFGFVYDGVFHSSETGYDPELRAFEVGTLMFTRLADELAQEDVTRLDFGIGDAAYKERFSDTSWHEAPGWMFAPTAKGFALATVQRLFATVDSSARWLAQRTGLTDRVKTTWRRHLGSSPTPSSSHSEHP